MKPSSVLGLAKGALGETVTASVTNNQKLIPSLFIIGNFSSGWDSASPQSCEFLANALKQSGVSVFTASRVQNRALRLIDMLLALVRNRDLFGVAIIDVFSTSGLVWAEASAALGSKLGKSIVLVLRGGNLLRRYQKSPSRLGRLFSKADAIVSPSDYLAEGFRDRGFCVHVIPNPVELNSLPFRERSKVIPRAIWMRCFDRDTYNPQMAVRAIGKIRETFPDAKLVMVGPDRGALADIRHLAKRLGVSDAIEFPGYLRKPELLFRAHECDILLNTNNIDNMPVSVIESQAMGLCVVCTAVGGVPHLVTHEVDGMLVPSDDDEAMAAAVVRLVRDPDLAARISRNARARSEQYSWPKVFEMWKRLLSEITSKAKDNSTGQNAN